MDGSLIAALGVGFLIGVRHALEADHVAAVSTFVTQERSIVRGCLRGTFWGIGHTAALLGVGVAMIAFKLRMSPALERTAESVVALALILLGGHALLRALGGVSLHARLADVGRRLRENVGAAGVGRPRGPSAAQEPVFSECAGLLQQQRK